jgi:hypothetical protein
MRDYFSKYFCDVNNIWIIDRIMHQFCPFLALEAVSEADLFKVGKKYQHPQ